MNNFRDKIRGLTGLHTALEGLLTTINQIPVSGSATDSNFIDWVGRVAISTLTTKAKTVEGAINELAADYIVEQGTSGMWTYEKWASGKAVCWGAKTYTDVSCTTANGTGLFYGQISGISFPTNLFNSISFIDIYPVATSGGCISVSTLGVTKNSIDTMYPRTPTSRTLDSLTAYISVKGTWK